APALAAKIATLELQVRDLSARPAAPDQRRAQEVEARLKALESGAAAPRPLQSDPAVLEKLAELDRRAEQALAAAREAKTSADVGQNLSKLAPAMLKAAGNAPPQGGVLDRLQASAARLVRVRPIEEAAGDEPSAAIARAELEASRGDIPGALADLDKLPDAA